MPVSGNINGLAIMPKGRLVDVDKLECKILKAHNALSSLLDENPILGAKMAGTSTLGNLLVELSSVIDDDLRKAHLPKFSKCGAVCPYCGTPAI